MSRPVAPFAQPLYERRPVIVRVVHLSDRTPARPTRTTQDLPSPQIRVRIAPRVILLSLVNRKRVGLSPLPHVGRMAPKAEALRFSARLPAPTVF